MATIPLNDKCNCGHRRGEHGSHGAYSCNAKRYNPSDHEEYPCRCSGFVPAVAPPPPVKDPVGSTGAHEAVTCDFEPHVASGVLELKFSATFTVDTRKLMLSTRESTLAHQMDRAFNDALKNYIHKNDIK